MIIWDCRRKELLTIRRVGGDFEIRIMREDGKTVYVGWFRMKRPHDLNYKRIAALFLALQQLLEYQ